ncbi:MAG: hypothetical protein ABIY55_09350, partial [Kofleriaceae bacterium]
MMTSFCARSSSPALLGLGFLVATVAACGSVVDSHALPDGGAQVPPDGGAQVPPDSAPPTARCRPSEPFGAPTPVAGVNTAADEFSFALTRGELIGFVSRVVQDPVPSATILAAQRATRVDPFATPSADTTSLLNGVDGDEYYPFPSSDGLS